MNVSRPHDGEPAPARPRPSWWRAWIVLPWVIGGFWFLYESIHYHVVASRQRKTTGTITIHDPANHSRYGYTFVANRRVWYGWQIPKGDDQWTIGQQVVVYYDSTDPSTNSLRDFSEVSLEAAGPLLMIAVGVSVVVLVIFLMRRKPPALPSAG